MVNGEVALCPIITFPNAKFPLNAMTRVAEVVGVEGVDGADGVVGALLLPHAVDRITSRTRQPRLNIDISVSNGCGTTVLPLPKPAIQQVHRDGSMMNADKRVSGTTVTTPTVPVEPRQS
jgi:hypothetical protein